MTSAAARGLLFVAPPGSPALKRMFVALKPCIEGFHGGCRPYLAVDSTFLTGRFKGQLASATAIDGHNWMYPICFGEKLQEEVPWQGV
jgi:hypothetical protein